MYRWGGKLLNPIKSLYVTSKALLIVRGLKRNWFEARMERHQGFEAINLNLFFFCDKLIEKLIGGREKGQEE